MLMLGRYKNNVGIPVSEKMFESPARAKPPALALELNHLEWSDISRFRSANLRSGVRHASCAMLDAAVRLDEKTSRMSARSKSARGDCKCARRSRPFPRAMKK